MVDRGKSPGAKGTAFPHAFRPQKSGPPFVRKGLSGKLGLPAKPAGPPAPPVTSGKPLAASKKPATATAKNERGGTNGNARSDTPARADAGPAGVKRSGPNPGSRNKVSVQANADEAGVKRSGPKPDFQKKRASAAPAAGGAPRPKAAPGRPVTAPRPAIAEASRSADDAPPSGVRVSKLLAERGLCSRREADEYIAQGLVFVNGERVTELGVRADPGAAITLGTEARAQQEERITILLNKPIGYVSGLPEDGHQPAVVLVRPETHHKGRGEPPFQPVHLKGLAPAGRLDIDSTGMLVLTQDGRIARQLIGEDSTVEKEYLVRVEGKLIEGGMEQLRHGLSLDGQALKPAEVEWLNEDQLSFVLREGKKRQIRRMCELVGLKVIGLKRVRMGRVRLGELPMGKWRYLKPEERF